MFKKFLPQIIAFLFLAGFVAYAWTEPGSVPPGGNVDAPVNVGTATQTLEDNKTLMMNQNATGTLMIGGALGIGGVLQAFSDVCIGGVCKNAWPASGASFWDIIGSNIYNTNSGNVGIGTNNPGSKLDIQGGDVKVTAIPSGTAGSYSLNWNRIQICQFGTCAPPWKDIDFDGKTYMAGTDCDEGCSTCYVGSTAVTTAADGKDQNCNGVVDELVLAGPSKVCSIPGDFLVGLAQGNCSSYCQGLGFGSGVGTSAGGGCCSEEMMFGPINYNNCTGGNGGSTSNQQFESGPFTCTCQSYQ